MTHIRGRVWVDGQPRDGFEFAGLSEYLATPKTLAWCDIDDPDHETLRELAHEIGLNEWAVEDTLAEAERTKAMFKKRDWL